MPFSALPELERLTGSRAPGAIAFRPASHLPYECTIHTLQMKGDDGRTYNVVLDLIRNDQNDAWGISQDRRALRAAVVDAATGELVASKFIDKPKDEMTAMHIMDASGHIGLDLPDMKLSLDATVFKSTAAQAAADAMKALSQKSGAGPLQLLVTDYPKTQHSGTMELTRADGTTLKLTAASTPSTVSHHYGNSLTDYVFLASTPKPGKPSFIAVITKEGIDLDPSKPGAEMKMPFGYIIRTDADGKSSFSFLTADADKDRDGFDIGSDFLGTSLDVKVRGDVGSVTLNDGQLPSRTAYGSVTIKEPALLRALGLRKNETYDDVIVDVTGSFLQDTGRD